MKAGTLVHGTAALMLAAAAVQAGPVTNGGFDNTPQNPAAINPWQPKNGSRIALANCTSTNGTTVSCNSTIGLAAGMRLSGAGLLTSPANATAIVALPVTQTSFAVGGGAIASCPSALLASNAVPPPTLSVGRTAGTSHGGNFSLRVDGRDSAVDGPIQSLAGLVNGARYTTRFAIKLDAPAQVRCLAFLPGSTQPVILAEKVVDAAQVGQWIPVEGTTTLGWNGTQSVGQILFAVHQVYQVGTASPAGAFPGYNLDTVEMEIDTDGDGYWDIEEVPGNAKTNPLLADTDADGLPDKWEGVNQLNPNDPNDALLDADGDGHSNKIEYWANTNPGDGQSFPGRTTDSMASPATKALLYYLQTRGARGNGRYLTGHHAQDIAAGDYSTYVAGLNALMGAAGQQSWVSILSIAAEGPTAAQPLQIATSAPVLRSYMDAGGIGIIHWTPRNPWTNNSNGDKTGVDIADLLTPGTTANVRMVGWMDAVAAEIAAFGPDRPVIFRPLNEQNGAWNWFGQLPRDDFFALYRWVRSHFENSPGYQHNIIWTIEHHIGAHRPASTTNIGVAMDYYYPGDDAIDLVGFSAYVSGWDPGFDADAQSRLHPKAFAITEGGAPPNEDDVPNAYNSTYLPALDTWYPRAAFFVIWNSWSTGPHVAIKDNPGYVELLTDTRVTNREGLHWRMPSGFAANAASSTQFALGWNGTAGAVGYALEGSATGSAPWLPAGTSTPSAAVLGGFSPSTMRHFRVRALYPGGDSLPTDASAATTWAADIAASITLGNLSQTYNATSRAASLSTEPPGLAVSVTYDGSATPPIHAGNYTVNATVTEMGYVGSANGTLSIARKGVSVSGLAGVDKTYDGSAIANVAGTASLAGIESGDTVLLGGTPVFTFDSPGAGIGKPISASGYTISGASSPNYLLGQPANLSANITAASLAQGDITLLPAGNGSYTAQATGVAAFTLSYCGRTANGISSSYGPSSSAPSSAGYYTVTATSADGNYTTASKSEDYHIAGPVAFNDTAQKTALEDAVTITGASLLANDLRIDSGGGTASDGLSICAALAGAGNSVVLDGGDILAQGQAGAAPWIFSYTVTDATGRFSTATVEVVDSGPSADFSLRIVNVGAVAYSAGSNSTSQSFDFISVPAISLGIEATSNLLAPWSDLGQQSTGATGSFSVTITQPGDQRAAWPSSRFFRARVAQ